MPSWREQGQL